ARRAPLPDGAAHRNEYGTVDRVGGLARRDQGEARGVKRPRRGSNRLGGAATEVELYGLDGMGDAWRKPMPSPVPEFDRAPTPRRPSSLRSSRGLVERPDIAPEQPNSHAHV